MNIPGSRLDGRGKGGKPPLKVLLLKVAAAQGGRWRAPPSGGFVLRFRTGQIESTGELLEFLRDWLSTHVHESDRLFVDYIRERDADD